MYLHKENRELFRDAILLTSERLGVSEDIVEKDYYVTLILKKLSLIEYVIIICLVKTVEMQDIYTIFIS